VNLDDAWMKFGKEVRPEVEDRFGLFLEASLNREAAFKAMRHDLKAHCWVLDYNFSK
jgi:hypothetical protein